MEKGMVDDGGQSYVFTVPWQGRKHFNCSKNRGKTCREWVSETIF